MDDLLDQPRPGVWLGPIFAGLVIVATLTTQQPAARFQFNPDEGINLVKAALLADGYVLYQDIWSDQPAVFTWMLRGWFVLFGENVTAGRVLVMLLSALLAGVFCDTVRRTLGPTAAILGTAMLIVSKRYLALSASVMIGQPALALTMVSVWLMVVHRERPRRWMLLLSAAVFALALQTKAFVFFLAPLIVVQSLVTARLGVPWSRRWANAARWFAAAIIVSLLLLYLTGALSMSQLVAAHVAHATRDAYAAGDHLSRLMYELREHDPYLLLAAVGAVWALAARRWDVFLPLTWACVGMALLLNHRPIWYHHSMLVMIPMCWLCAYAISAAVESFKTARWKQVIGAVVIVFALAAIGLQINGRRLDMRERGGGAGFHTAQVLEQVAKQRDNAWVFTDQPLYAFRAGLRVPPELAVMSEKRLSSGALTDDLLLSVINKYKPAQLLLGRFPLDEQVMTVLNAQYDFVKTYKPMDHYVRKAEQ